MIGFLLPSAPSAAITSAIADAQTSRDLPVTWLLVGMPILTGEHAGLHFLPASDEILSCPLHRGMTPQDFPEFAQLIGLLGGLEARVDLAPHFIAPPQENL